jgi:hypothetical protein
MVAELPSRTDPHVTPDTMIPDLLRANPRARDVFDRYGLHGCGGRHGPVESIAFFAKTHGVDEIRLLDEIQESLRVSTPPAPTPKLAVIVDSAAAAPSIADTIYRRFFLGGIVLILTAGASWGAWLLWQIGFAGRFTGVSIQHVNAHGHAQIYGWVGLFIMGFAYQAFPRIWHTRLAAPRLAAAAFVLMVVGLIVRTVGMTAGDGLGGYALHAAMLGGALEALAVVIFAAQMLATFRRSSATLEPYVGFAFAAIVWFIAQAALDLWHTYTTMTAASAQELVWYVSTYQAPLRDLQIHGLALFMILGVSIRMLPALFDLPPVPRRRAWWSLGILTAAVIGEVALFIVYRQSGNHAIAALLMIPWLMLAIGCAMVAWSWRLWRRFAVPDRSGKFVRAAYAWLAISFVMLLLLPVYQVVSDIKFSHAYYGAIRHAITVGFISLMIMGMAAKVVATLNGRDARKLSSLWGPFILVNVGCFLRVTTQTLTDWHHGFFAIVGVSGMLEVTGLAWWGVGLVRIMREGAREALSDDDAAASADDRPRSIEAAHCVADVLRWFPDTLEVFVSHGFTLLAQPMSRRVLARRVTIRQAAALRGVPADQLLRSLNSTIDREAAN